MNRKEQLLHKLAQYGILILDDHGKYIELGNDYEVEIEASRRRLLLTVERHEGAKVQLK